jgi:LacI family transcriptional regulator
MVKVTIEDVAELAKVSIKTVSRVINNESHVRTDTVERVREAIRALDYKPNPSARSLAASRSFVVGLLYDNPSSSYVIDIQLGALGVCDVHHYELLIHPCDHGDHRLADDLINLVRNSKVDGFLLTPPISDNQVVIASLSSNEIPHVRIAPGDRRAAHGIVLTNDFDSSVEMTGHLAALGHRRIAFVKGHPDHLAQAERYGGYLEGMRNAGLEVDEDLVSQGYNSFDSGIQCAEDLLRLPDPPTAIFAANDQMAVGVMRVARLHGLDIPGDLSVAGFDDAPIAQQIYPSLTTVRQPVRSMAAAATEMLLSQLRSGPANDAAPVIASSIQIRESTGPCRTRRG